MALRLRPPVAEDAADIARIVREHGLPAAWTWPDGKHGIVAATEDVKNFPAIFPGRVVAFCILQETIYGLVIDELWEELTREGIAGLGMLSREIERIAQRLANEHGAPLSCGGIVRLDRPAHIAALRKRGYDDEAVILTKLFLPDGGRGIGTAP